MAAGVQEDCEFVITTDPYSFNSLAFLPQARLLILLMNQGEPI